MHFSALFLVVALASASPLVKNAAKPPAFFLAGDSTTATITTGGGGWGDGFLETLTNGAIGQNFARNGRTTVDFVTLGYWANVIAAVKSNKANYSPYVTIQFGHNDQKPEKNISIAEYSTNLKNLANEVISSGGTPILVSPLSRRSYSSSTGKINENLSNERTAVLAVASANKFKVIDLNKNSTAYLNAIGQTNAVKYNLNPDDNTHLNKAGQTVFGNMVASLIEGLDAALDSYINPNQTILAAIKKGTFILP
ncbi:GDSL-like Lipase/Acylhydrolase [Phlyctema vagabunda]|uniref:GDSL-like Lipase/Acylhydrolase n=1 Tax=Phlyctema vagabunda TaxID=108571 RepID=A0ABR4P621_9HELO